MAQPEIDTAIARNLMVDCQVRPNKVTDGRIVAAMRVLPRECFVPPALAPLAYCDEDVPLGGGRFLTEPMVIARLVQMTRPVAGERALVVGAGSGYAAALLAACGVSVTALEQDPALLALARAVLPELAPAVRLVEGTLDAGYEPGAPYDIVLVDGALEQLPDAVAGQVKPQVGRVACVMVGPGPVGRAMLGERTTAGMAWQPVFDCSIPLLAGVRRPVGFMF